MKTLLLAGLLFAHPAHADQQLHVLEVHLTATPAWGTNSAAITIKNSDTRPRDVLINWQATSLMLGRGWGLDSTETIAAGETRSFPADYVIPAFPGKVAFRFRVRDAAGSPSDPVLWERKTEYEFPFDNNRANALRIPPRLQKGSGLTKGEYPRLRMAARGRIVIYFLEDDAYVQGRIDEIARQRERIYGELAGKINPAFDSQIAVYLFPDADSKLAYTNHRGLGMANGRVLAEIYNEKERIDPYHEVTHIIAGSIGDPPALFNEGLAAWSQEGHRWDGIAADSWAKGFAARGMLWPMGRIFAFHEFGSEGSRAPIAYPQGASIVNFLIGRYGFDRFLTAYRTLKNSADPQANAVKFAEIFGAGVDAVGKAWLASLADPTIPAAPDRLLEEIQAKYK